MALIVIMEGDNGVSRMWIPDNKTSKVSEK
jgi:hypothetical protein